jgi:hypothetical protein
MAEYNIQAVVMYELVCLWVLGGKDGPVQHGGGGGGSSGGGGNGLGPVLWLLMFFACLAFFVMAFGDSKGVRF